MSNSHNKTITYGKKEMRWRPESTATRIEKKIKAAKSHEDSPPLSILPNPFPLPPHAPQNFLVTFYIYHRNKIKKRISMDSPFRSIITSIPFHFPTHHNSLFRTRKNESFSETVLLLRKLESFLNDKKSIHLLITISMALRQFFFP